MEKELTLDEQKLAKRYYALKMAYRIKYGRYLEAQKKANIKHEQAMEAHKQLREFITAYGEYDQTCPPTSNKLIP